MMAAAIEAALSAVRESHAGEVSALRERITQAEQAHATEVAVLRETMTVLEAKAAILEQARASAEARADRAAAALTEERSRADAFRVSLDEAHALRQQAREAQQAEAAAQVALQAADALRQAEVVRRWKGRLAGAWQRARRGAPTAIGLARTGYAVRDAIGRVRNSSRKQQPKEAPTGALGLESAGENAIDSCGDSHPSAPPVHGSAVPGDLPDPGS